MRGHMCCTRLMIGSFLKTADLVLVDEINELYDQSYVPIETTGGGKRQNIPIVDPNAVLRCEKVFIIVKKC